MKKKTGIIIAIIVIVVALAGIGAFFLLRGESTATKNGNALSNVLRQTSGELNLDEAVPFEWDKAYSFAPYTDTASMAETIGFSDDLLREGQYDDLVNLVFVKDDKIVAVVYGHESDIGYRITFDNPTAYGEKKIYTSEKKDGIVVLTVK